MSNDLVIIACSAKKLKTNTAVPAVDLYQGELFKAQLAFARQCLKMPDTRILILSAWYGLMRSDAWIQPYDYSLNTMKTERRRAWGMGVAYTLGIATGVSGALIDRVFVMGGKLYRKPIEAALAGCSTDVITLHPDGLGYAQQVAWYKKQVNKNSARKEPQAQEAI